MARDASGFANQDATPNWSPDGYGNQQYQGEYYGKNAYDKDVDRYRAQGVAAQNVAPIAVDQTQANESRGLQVGALGLLRAQAEGTAPSASEILSQRANQQGATAIGSAGTAAHTTGGGIAALRNAGAAAGNAMLTANAANANARGAEVSRGQGQYASGAGSLEGQDIGVAETDAKLAAQQRALNEQRQQYMERQAQNTQFLQHQNTSEYLRQAHAAQAAQRAYEAAKTQADWNKAVGVISAVSSLGQNTSGLAAGGSSPQPPPDDSNPDQNTTSDERAKCHIGSLASLRRRAE